MHDLKQQIKAALAAKGWTHSELSRKTGVQASSICRWMLGTGGCTLATFLKLCDALDYEVALTPRKESSYGTQATDENKHG